MNIRTRICVLLLLLTPMLAWAGQGHDHKPLHGGIVAEAKDVDVELVTRGDVVALYIRINGKPFDPKGGTARVTVLSGQDKAELALVPVADRFEARGGPKVGPGSRVVAAITLPGRPSVSVRFAIK